MIYIVIGSDCHQKRRFIQEVRGDFPIDSFVSSINVVFGKDISSSKILQDLFRVSGLGGRKLVIVWDVDSLSKKIFGQIVDILQRYVENTDSIVVVLEGSGSDGSISSQLCKIFPNRVRAFGDVLEEETLFSLAESIIKADFSRVWEYFSKRDFNQYEFQQLVGVLRFVIERNVRDINVRANMLKKLVDLDVGVKMGKVLWDVALFELMHMYAARGIYAS